MFSDEGVSGTTDAFDRDGLSSAIEAVEHGTAAAYAALTSGAYLPAPGERVVVLLCGANTDPSDLA